MTVMYQYNYVFLLKEYIFTADNSENLKPKRGKE